MSAEPALDRSALTPDEVPEKRTKLGTWFAFVRRARLGPQRKMVALVLGSYANNDGTSVKCGIAGLAAACEMGYSTARRHLAWMREHDLVELVTPGNARLGRADVYRLILGPRSKAIEVPEEEFEALKEDLRDANRAGQKVRRITDQRSPRESAGSRASKVDARPDSPDSEEASALTTPSAENADQRSLEARSALTPGRAATSHIHLPEKTSSQPGGAPPPDPRRPDAPPTSGRQNEQPKLITNGETNLVSPSGTTSAARASPARCRHGIRIRRRTDGAPNCALCRRETDHPPPDNVIPFPRPA